MKKLLKSVIIIATILSLAVPRIAIGDCPVALQLCNEALVATEKELTETQKGRDRDAEFISVLATQRNEAYDRLGKEDGNNWATPVVVTITFISAFVFGALVAKEVK